MKQKRFSDELGLRLSRPVLRVLKGRGILAHSPISLEHQHLAKRYVVRGVESGGAVGDLGQYVTFTQEDGQPLEWLHPVEAIGVNGLHAVAVSLSFLSHEGAAKYRLSWRPFHRSRKKRSLSNGLHPNPAHPYGELAVVFSPIRG